MWFKIQIEIEIEMSSNLSSRVSDNEALHLLIVLMKGWIADHVTVWISVSLSQSADRRSWDWQVRFQKYVRITILHYFLVAAVAKKRKK